MAFFENYRREMAQLAVPESVASIDYIEDFFQNGANWTRDTYKAANGARCLVGAANVDTDPTPEMGSEDFAFMLQAKPGCYVWLGAGRGPDTPNIHNPQYDFNDDALPIGASYWVTLAEQQLSANAVRMSV